jgi:hypothetical protein
MRKIISVEQVFCDFCSSIAHAQCELCGKDVCYNCVRKICSIETPIPNSGGPSAFPTSYWPVSQPYKEVMTVCVGCVDALKLSIRIASTKKREK